jgi:hypothetical protein
VDGVGILGSFNADCSSEETGRRQTTVVYTFQVPFPICVTLQYATANCGLHVPGTLPDLRNVTVRYSQRKTKSEEKEEEHEGLL